MELDFTALQEIAPEAPETPQGAGNVLPGAVPSPIGEKASTGQNGRRPGTICEGIEAMQEAGALKRAIIDDLDAGEDLQGILLKAVDCIGLLTQDAGIYGQCLEKLRKGYGYDLREQLQDTRDRIAETEKALRRADLEPPLERIFKRVLDIYQKQEKDLQEQINAYMIRGAVEEEAPATKKHTRKKK